MRRSDGDLDLLKLAVIIPSLNEEQNIRQTIQSVRGKGVSEIIVVDGGSQDKTISVAKANGAKVIRAPRGRGQQLNAGWRASKADWCLFLHADTQLPPDFKRLISQTLQRQQKHEQRHEQQRSCWGCFKSIQLTQVPTWQSWLIEHAVALRTQLLRLPYGDQALFVRRKTLEEVQGFPEWRVLEDVAMVQKLNQLAPPSILPKPVSTSGRRYNKLGFWHTVLTNQAIMFGWSIGLEQQCLEKLYDRCSQVSQGW